MLNKNKKLNSIQSLSLAAILSVATISVALANDASTEEKLPKDQQALIQPIENTSEKTSENTSKNGVVNQELDTKLDSKKKEKQHTEGKCGG